MVLIYLMIPCVLCAKCCEQTEMLLSNEDIRRIQMRTKLPKQKFAFLQEGYYHLRNHDKFCVFLDKETSRCKIYAFRPLGCRFYPIIFDPYQQKCVVDKDCSNRREIPTKLVRSQCSALKQFLRLLEQERNYRIKNQERR
ncbi:MAG: YkgJ family cysteine cluster protein [Candidatus Helarchaeota archaeon]